MNKAIDTIVKQFKRRLGGQLEGIFLYGSCAQGFYQEGESDINLLVVIADGTNIHALRQMFLLIWKTYGEVLKHAPLIAPYNAFVRHMQLNPMLAHHISRDGKQLFGNPDLLEDVLPRLDINSAYAHLASEAMEASKALIVDLLEPETAVSTQAHLRNIVRRIRREPLTKKETSTQLFARIQHFLPPIINKLPVAKQWTSAKSAPSTSPLLPGLQTIYKESGNMIFVFGQLTPQQIMRTDWGRLSEFIGNNCKGIEITSVAQFCLIVSYERPLAIPFQKYEHNWGIDFLPMLTTSPKHMLQQAARRPSQIQLQSLPHAVLTQTDEALGEIIHDFQNKMLNVQLEHELMVRFKLVERFTPPEPLPDRETPPRQRVDAIFKHLQWWADFYTEQSVIDNR